MTLKIEYNNGNKIEQKINYLHFENDTLFYTMDTSPHAVIQEPVEIPLANIKAFDLN